jgi:hypothetical protein
MPRHELRKVDSYIAVDGTGKRHTITVYATFTEVVTLAGSEGWLEGTRQHRMPNGNHVNVLDDGTLEDIHTGLKMRRVTSS